MNIEKLRTNSQTKAQTVPLRFERYLADKINWKNRLIGITGARGSGKTTLILQHLAKNLPKDGSALYVAMDDLFSRTPECWNWQNSIQEREESIYYWMRYTSIRAGPGN